jgi:hypothetical protein
MVLAIIASEKVAVTLAPGKTPVALPSGLVPDTVGFDGVVDVVPTVTVTALEEVAEVLPALSMAFAV